MTGTVAAIVWGDVPRHLAGRGREGGARGQLPFGPRPSGGVPSERMTTIPEGARRFLATGPLAHVITLDADGSPHVSLAWAGFEGDQVVFSSFFDQRKLANLRRDPRVTLSFQANENVDKEFLHPYLVIEGRAAVTPGGAMAVMDWLAPAYLGPGARFPNREMPDGFTIHVDVDKVYGMGNWRGARR